MKRFVYLVAMALLIGSLSACQGETDTTNIEMHNGNSNNPAPSLSIKLNRTDSPKGEVAPGNRLLAVYDVTPPTSGSVVYGIRLRQVNASPYIADPTNQLWVEDASGKNVFPTCTWVDYGYEAAYYTYDCWGELNVPTTTKLYVLGHVNQGMAQPPDQNWDPPPLFYVEILDLYAADEVIFGELQGNDLEIRYSDTMTYLFKLAPDSPPTNVAVGTNVELMKILAGTDIGSAYLYQLWFNYDVGFDGAITNCHLDNAFDESINVMFETQTWGGWVYLGLKNDDYNNWPMTELRTNLQLISLKCDVSINNPNQTLNLELGGVGAMPVQEEFFPLLDPINWPRVSLTVN